VISCIEVVYIVADLDYLAGYFMPGDAGWDYGRNRSIYHLQVGGTEAIGAYSYHHVL
jgi:hypothetical protein